MKASLKVGAPMRSPAEDLQQRPETAHRASPGRSDDSDALLGARRGEPTWSPMCADALGRSGRVNSRLRHTVCGVGGRREWVYAMSKPWRASEGMPVPVRGWRVDRSAPIRPMRSCAFVAAWRVVG